MGTAQLSDFSAVLTHLGASLLVSLPSPLLLELLTQPGLHQYPPAQVSKELFCLL